jgi:hypothetical protein
MKKITLLLFFCFAFNVSFAQITAKCARDTFFIDLTGKIFSSVTTTVNPDWIITINCLSKVSIETKLIFEPEDKGSDPNPNLTCEINILKDGNQLYNLIDAKGPSTYWEQVKQEKIKLDHINKNFQLAVQLKYCTTNPSNDARLKMKNGSYIMVIVQPH